MNAENADAGKRLDVFILERLPEHSRARVQQWIRSGGVLVNGSAAKSAYIIKGSEAVDVTVSEPPPLRAVAEEIPLEILYSDTDVVAVNKPAGMVVHAGAGRHSGTLVNALLHHLGGLSSVGGEARPGIVHRLDRDTSGVLLVARNDAAHRRLAGQFASRTVEKRYVALVQGVIVKERGEIRSAIARDPVRRTRMSVRVPRGRTAHTEYVVARRFPRHTLLDVYIHTGRTHQIRVHLASIGHPVAGDTLYGAGRTSHGRFFLHAASIGFESPSSGERITVEAPIPPDLEAWLRELSAPL